VREKARSGEVASGEVHRGERCGELDEEVCVRERGGMQERGGTQREWSVLYFYVTWKARPRMGSAYGYSIGG
jgi:hypothetical protein